MGKFEDLTGQVFGQLTVIQRAENDKYGNTRWLCRCDCGKECIVAASALKSGQKSCGCYNLEKVIERSKKHGMYHTKIYGKWASIMNRCYNPNNHAFDHYGGRGIKVCERWHDFNNFYEDVSKMEYFGEKGYTLDRENNDGDYCPENVRWATKKQQTENRRNTIKVIYEGVEMTLAEAAEKSGINYGCLFYRYQHGDRGEKLFRPARKLTKK